MILDLARGTIPVNPNVDINAGHLLLVREKGRERERERERERGERERLSYHATVRVILKTT